MFEIVLIFLLAFFFWGMLMLFIKPVRNSSDSPVEEERVECSLCGKFYPPKEMLEREMGDSKVYQFCSNCVARMQLEFTRSKGSL